MFLGGLSFHDQHREMRLDIDNMSYEVCCSVVIRLQHGLHIILSKCFLLVPYFGLFFLAGMFFWSDVSLKFLQIIYYDHS